MPKLLIVDDNEDNRDVLSRRLARKGFEIVVAPGGQEGVDLAQSEQPDLILMDMNMPVLDGWEATRQIRKLGIASPVISMTAHAMDGDRERALEAGCTDYHSKPVEMEKLLKQIEAHLS